MGRRRTVLPLVLFIMLEGCVAPLTEPPKQPEPARVIYVVRHSWHTGLVVQREDISDALWPEHHDFPVAKYLEIGWGDKDFYQAPEASVSVALKAAFNSTASVLHIVGFRLPPTDYFPESEVIEVRLSVPGFERLSTFIHDTYQRDAQGRTIPLGPGWYLDSRFYLATGKYHLLNTCNTWIARALQAAGCPINPASALTAGQVASQVKTFGTMLRASSEQRDQPARAACALE